jgi:RimJ/RimL family protein N-acetyltransferase
MVVSGSPLYWPSEPESSVVLRDGARAVVRTLAGGDVAVVQQVFDGLSDESRRQRFAGPKPALSPRDLDALAAVDHRDHDALVAMEPGTGRAVGEARVIRDRCDGGVGEVAFAVADAWQGRGLGASLADLLARRARELGMRRLRATMLSDNVRSRALLRRMGRVVVRRYDRGAVELEVALD